MGAVTSKRCKTPTVLQMEAVECGAAALAIVLAYYGRQVTLEELRVECGVSRDGSKAVNLLKAARKYGLEAKGFKKNPESLRSMQGPMIIHWNFNHFLVLEGFRDGKVYLNDPAIGPRVVSEEELDQSFTGVVLQCSPSEEFVKGGNKGRVLPALGKRVRGSETAIAFVVLVGLALVLPGLVVPTFLQVFVDQVLLGQMNNWLFPLLIGMAATAVIRGVLTWLQQHFLLRLETKLSLKMSGEFLWHVLRLPIEFFSQRYSGEVGSRVMINNKVALMLSRDLATNVLNLFVIVFYFLLMLRYSVWLSLIGLGISLLNLAFLRFVSRRRVDQNQKLAIESGKMQGVSMDGLLLIETLKSSGSEGDFFAKWTGYASKLFRFEQESGETGLFLNAFPPLLTQVNTAVILLVGGLEVMNGELTIGMLVAFQFLMTSFLAPVNKMVELGGQLQEVGGDLKRLDDVLNYRLDPSIVAASSSPTQETDASPSLVPKGRVSTKLVGHIELKNVTFGYSPLEPPLIENFNLSIKPGSRVALVGGSGSGKSTISKLVSGLYLPWSGEICFDGVSRLDISRDLFTHSLSIVDQDIHLFEGTIKENITLWDGSLSEMEVIRAAKEACIHDDITARKLGYDSEITEGGRNFSGGQRQRLEIARALVSNPSILLLDEATSALDPHTEQQVDAYIRRRGCTCIIVAHRLSTIRDADEIIVMDQGKVVERGTHEQMKDAGGPYSRLISAH